MKEPKITFDELMKELERHEVGTAPIKTITNEQAIFLATARNRGLSYKDVANLWNRMDEWPRRAENSIRNWYLRAQDICKERGLKY